MLGKLRSLLHLSVATLFGLGGASAAVLTGQEGPAEVQRNRPDAEPEIVLAAARTVEATDSLETFLELYAGPAPKPVVAKKPVVKKTAVKKTGAKKTAVKKHRHSVSKKVVPVQRKAVKKQKKPGFFFGNPAPGRGY